MKKKKFKFKNQKIIVIIIAILIIIFNLVAINQFRSIYTKNYQEKVDKIRQNQILKQIKKNYGSNIVTTKKSKLYIKEKDKYVEAGEINKDIELTLAEIEPTIKNKYFLITDFEDEYYIPYDSVKKVEDHTEKEELPIRYIPFNENVETKDITTFYNEDDKIVFSFNKKHSLPIQIKEKDRYGVIFNNQLLYIKSSDNSKIIESKNTSESATDTMSVLAYHFFYEAGDNSCNQVICTSMKDFKQQMKHLMDNNYNFLTAREFEMFIDGEIRFKRNSILITIDDGWLVAPALAFLNENKLNAAIAPIANSFSKDDFKSEYIEVISHSFDMHNNGECPGMGGQGGGILCKSKEDILVDLDRVRMKLGNDVVYHVYPFYDYNQHAINVLKEAGFKMAFAGYYTRAKVGQNKYNIPRFTILSDTTFQEFLKII